jgi:TolA-binding protein
MVLFLIGCSVDSTRNHYVLAERLWTDHKYKAAVSEFEKVVSKDPRGKLGLQAMYRAAMTQYLFLGEFGEAIKKFKYFSQLSSDSLLSWDAQIQIGEILYSRLQQYDQAVLHYRGLVKLRSDAPEIPEILFRIGKSHFFIFQFKESILTYQELIKTFPHSSWAEKAAFEIGTTYFTQGEKTQDEKHSGVSTFQKAIDAYDRFIRNFPKNELVSEAKFGKASCLEELDQLEKAYKTYESLKGIYPSPAVLEIKLARIRERTMKRNVSR